MCSLLVNRCFLDVRILSDGGGMTLLMNNRRNYPKDWKKKALECKNAAGWKCEKCKIEQGTLCISWAGNERNVYMVAAHPNHDPQNPNAELVCVCPRCHWRHYRNH